MALTVGELVGFIRLDSSEWDRGLDSAKRNFSGLGTLISNGTKAMATAVGSVAIAAAGVGAAVFKVGADYNRMQQSSRAALETLLGSAEAANAQMDKLDAFASKSPFAKQVFIQAQQQLLGFGYAAEDVLPTLDAIQQAVAATGGSNEQISGLTEIFAKISSSAKITGEDLNQFGGYGIDAATMIGEAMGYTGAEIRDQITKGTLDAQVAISALTSQMMTRFGGATDGIKEQFDGAVDRIKGAWRDIGSVLATPFIDPMGGGMAVVWANKVADAMRALQAKAEPLVDLLIERFRPGLDAVTPALESVKSAINGWDLSQVNSQLDALGEHAPFIAAAGSALFFMFADSLPYIGRLVPAISPVLGAIAALIAFIPGMDQVGETLLSSLEPVVPYALDLASALEESVLAALAAVVPALIETAEAVGPLAESLASNLTPALIGGVEATVPMVKALADLLGMVAGLPTPVLAGAAAVAVLTLGIGPAITVVRTLGTATATLTASLAASRAVALAMGTQVGFMGAAALSARAAVAGLGISLQAALISTGIGAAVVALGAAFGVLVAQQQTAKALSEDYRATLDKLGNATDATSSKMIDAILSAETGWMNSNKSIKEILDNIGISVDTYRRAMEGSAEAQDAVTRAEERYLETASNVEKATSSRKYEIDDLRNFQEQQTVAVEDATEAQKAKAEAEKEAGISTDDNTSAILTNIEAIDAQMAKNREATDVFKSYKEAIIASDDSQARAADSITRWQEAVANAAAVNADSTKTEEEKKVATDNAAQAYRDAETAILNTSGATNELIDAMIRNGDANDTIVSKVATARDSLIAQRTALGDTQEQAEAYADALGLIPVDVETSLKLKDEASAKLNEINGLLNGLDKKVVNPTVQVNGKAVVDFSAMGNATAVNQAAAAAANSIKNLFKADGGILQAYADGGIDQNGSVVERSPQIAQGGRNIVWAEQSTGWEAYVSGKPDQRQRNLAVLDEAARRFGRVVVPAGTTPYANGGFSGEGGGGAAVATMIPTELVVVDTDGQLITRMRVEATRAINDDKRVRSGYRGYQA